MYGLDITDFQLMEKIRQRPRYYHEFLELFPELHGTIGGRLRKIIEWGYVRKNNENRYELTDEGNCAIKLGLWTFTQLAGMPKDTNIPPEKIPPELIQLGKAKVKITHKRTLKYGLQIDPPDLPEWMKIAMIVLATYGGYKLTQRFVPKLGWAGAPIGLYLSCRVFGE